MTCDVGACFRQYFSKEAHTADTIKKASLLGAIYASRALDAQNALSEATRGARANLTALRVAKDQGNAAAIARALVGVKTSTARVRELRARIETSNALQGSCEKWAAGLEEARQHKHALGAFSELKRQFKSLHMGALAENAEDTMADLGAVNEELGDIRAIMGAGPASQAASNSTPEDDARELEALLDEEYTTVQHSTFFAAPPQVVVDTHPRKTIQMPTVDAYAAALAAS